MRARAYPGQRAGSPRADASSDHGQSDAAVAEAAHAALAAAVARWRDGAPTSDLGRRCAVQLSEGTFARAPRAVDAAVARLLADPLAAALARGWLPEDIHQIVRRRLPEAALSLVTDVIATVAARFAAATIDPRWSQQLEQLGASTWWDSGAPHFGQWMTREGVDRVEALRTVIALTALIETLPTLPVIVPPPGTARASSRAHRNVDEKMLSRVRALLAKAESTEYAPEAEALSTKAQELMSRYAIEQAMLETDPDAVLLPGARRVWLDAPYLQPKATLVAAVAGANRCRGVASLELGFVTVIGDEVELQLVELLTTSLLVQATTAMVVAGRQTDSYGQSRTRSFRHSFLVAYAARIGERLRAQADHTVAAAGTDLVPVLAERERLVDSTFRTLFPRTRRLSSSVGNAAGWDAGRSAADAAVLQAGRSAVRGPAPG